MKDKYLQIAINKELENSELKREIDYYKKFNNRLLWGITIVIALGIILLFITHDWGEIEGINKSYNNCINYLCEKGNCAEWSDYDYVKEVCKDIITTQLHAGKRGS